MTGPLDSVFTAVWSSLPSSFVTWMAAYMYAFQHVELIAKPADGAWLFRSGGPWLFPRGLLSGAPAMDTESIRLALQKASHKAPLSGGGIVPMPWNVRLLDINLLQTDRADATFIELESDFFAQRREQGDFVLWPMNGVQPFTMRSGCQSVGVEDASCQANTRQLKDFDSASRAKLARSFPSWDPDNMDARVAEMHSLVGKLKDTAIFFHCSCGCDRTGQLFAAYAITHMNWTVQDAMKHNVAMVGRSTWYEHQASVQWYCEHLKESGRYHHDDCGVCGGGTGILCTPPGYLLDPFARILQERILLGLIGLATLSLLIRVCRRPRRRAKGGLDLDDDLSTAFLTPEHNVIAPFGKVFGQASPPTPSTMQPSECSSPSYSLPTSSAPSTRSSPSLGRLLSWSRKQSAEAQTWLVAEEADIYVPPQRKIEEVF